MVYYNYRLDLLAILIQNPAEPGILCSLMEYTDEGHGLVVFTPERWVFVGAL